MCGANEILAHDHHDGPSSFEDDAEVNRVREAMSLLVSTGSATAAETEEEAILLLVRQKNLENQQLQFEGVGVLEAVHDDHHPGSGPGVRVRDAGSSDSDLGGDDDLNIGGHLPGLPGHLIAWSKALTEATKAFEFLADHSGKELGQDRSISLVLMRAEPVVQTSSSSSSRTCSCVRCSYPGDDDMPDLLFVSWLNNTSTHGLLGRKARQVALDDSCKVLYSVADTRMAKTGFSKGFGYPELVCDAAHCDILVPYVGAAMRKVTKTSSDRDQVPEQVLRFRSFCEVMLSSFANASASAPSASSRSQSSSSQVGVWSEELLPCQSR